MSTEAKRKSELYLLKFQKYREEKEKLRKDNGKHTFEPKPVLKPKNAVQKSAFHIRTTNVVKAKTCKEKSKENEKPIVNSTKTVSSFPHKAKVTSVKRVPNFELLKKTFPVSNKAGPNPEPRKSFSNCNARKSLGHTEKPFKLEKSRPFLSKPSQNKPVVNSRKSTGSVVISKNSQTNTRKSFSSYNPTNPQKSFSSESANRNRHTCSTSLQFKEKTGVSKKRRYSDTQKHNKRERTKPTSILKRKSCFASFDVEGNIQLGKTPDHGRSVRFISPDVQDHNCSDNKYRKTSKRPVQTSDRLPTPVSMGKGQVSNHGNMKRQTTPKQSTVKKPRPSGQPAQIAMRNKLDDWLKSKGKTPSKFRHLMCFHEKDSNEPDVETDSCMKSSLSIDELTEQKSIMDREDSVVVNLADQFRDAALEELDSMLEECSTLYEAGCPGDDILRWLDSIEKNIKLSKTYAKFYICKAQVLKSSENLEDVLKVYETAVVNGAQPSLELATALTGIVKDVCQEREKKARRRSVNEVQAENIFESSAIKYTVRQVTPFSKKRRKSASDAKPTSPCVVITPVRRSTRRSISCLPSSLQDKTPTYRSLEDVSDTDRKKTLYFPNEAINDDLYN